MPDNADPKQCSARPVTLQTQTPGVSAKSSHHDLKLVTSRPLPPHPIPNLIHSSDHIPAQNPVIVSAN
jgi:hypothetical protein